MIELQLHGSPAVRRADGRAVALSAREAALLAWLHFEGPSPRGPLAGRLWPGGDDAKARANLRQTLARLKRGAGELLAEDDTGLRLAAGVTVAAAGGARLLGTLEFDDAPGFAEWLAARRDSAQRDRLREGLATARRHLETGELDAALAAADEVLAAEPAAEEAHRVRMEVFYLRGDHASAVAAWDDCRHQLRSAFGIAPSAATNELGRLVLAGATAPPSGALRVLPAALRRPPQLVGRSAVLADIERAFELGRGVVVAGVGGIGKSRLLAEAAARWAPAVATGARPGDALLPGAVMARLVQAAISRFEPLLDDDTRADIGRLRPGDGRPALRSALEQRRVLAAVGRTLAACRDKGLRLVVLDDLQYADDASLAAIQVVLGSWLTDAAGGNALPLFGARSDELSPAAAALLKLLDGSGRCTRFDLAPLQVADVRALLDALPLVDAAGGGVDADALATALLAQVGGNPAFLLDSLKSLWLDGFAGWSPGQPLPLPATLLDRVRQRLQSLPDAALQLAQLAAVARNDFTLALAAAALGRTPLQLGPLLAALESAQVFDGPGFAHDLVAEAVQRSLPAALLAPLHRVVAEHLITTRGAAPAIAFHLQAAGDPRAAAPWHLRAAQQARAVWQMAEAAASFEAAARGLDDERQRFGAWLGAARCWQWADHDDATAAALAQSAALVRDAVDTARQRTVHTIWCFNTRRLGDAVAGAEALIDAYGQHADALDTPTLVDGVRVVTSTVAYGVDLERALALVARLQALLATRRSADGDDGDAVLALRTARGGLLHWASRPREADEELQAAWQQAARDASTRVILANQRMRVHHALGDLPAARADGEWLLQAAAPLQLGVVFQTDVMHVLAMMDIAAGRAAAGLARFDALLQRLQHAAAPRPDLFVTSRTLALIAVGRLDDAADELARHPPAGRDGHGLQDLGYHLTQARLALACGRSPAPWLALAAQAQALPPGIVLQREVAMAAMQGGDADRLVALADELQQRGLRGLQRVATMAAARAALAAGRPAAAATLARQALALIDHVDAWVDEPPSAWLCAAEVLAGCGEHDDAAAAARAGAAWVRAGAEQWPDGPARAAWLHGNPIHRALLTQVEKAAPRTG